MNASLAVLRFLFFFLKPLLAQLLGPVFACKIRIFKFAISS